MQHPIHELLKVSLENLKEIVDVNTIIGDPIVGLDSKIIIIPVSKVKTVFFAGGTDLKIEDNFGGGTLGSVDIVPVAFLVINQNECKTMLLDASKNNIVDKILDLAPDIYEKIKTYLKK